MQQVSTVSTVTTLLAGESFTPEAYLEKCVLLLDTKPAFAQRIKTYTSTEDACFEQQQKHSETCQSVTNFMALLDEPTDPCRKKA